MNDEPKSKDGICQSDTDSKPTCGRPDEPLTSLKLTIIGHAPLALGAEIFFTFSVALDVFTVASTKAYQIGATCERHHYSSSRFMLEGVAIEIAEAVVGSLRGELAATAVNAPMVPAELRKKPWKNSEGLKRKCSNSQTRSYSDPLKLTP
ncbi:hypothetical protein Tco_1472488 [Tanacetum coccineum]